MVTWQATVPSSIAGPWPFWNLPPESAQLSSVMTRCPGCKLVLAVGSRPPRKSSEDRLGIGVTVRCDGGWKPSPAAQEAWLSWAGFLHSPGLCGLSFQDACLATTSLTLHQVARAGRGSPGVRRAPVTDAYQCIYLRGAWTAQPDSVTASHTRAPQPQGEGGTACCQRHQRRDRQRDGALDPEQLEACAVPQGTAGGWGHTRGLLHGIWAEAAWQRWGREGGLA